VCVCVSVTLSLSLSLSFVQAAAVLCGQGLVSSKNQHFGCTLVGTWDWLLAVIRISILGCTFSGSLVVIAAIHHFPIMLMIRRIRNFKG
jgi:hypothetical protein